MDYDDEISDVDGACPRCGQHALRSRECDSMGCEEGYRDEHDDDPCNFAPGELYTACTECLGTGDLYWCSSCGLDMNRYAATKRREAPQ
jgi:predicted RNA-binding Zn-ribbon protein involved in translation (DUF1610 family)